jgi:hypothetical protein
VAKGTGSRTTLWGFVRPAVDATRVTIQQADRGKGFRDLATVTTDARGYFTRRTANRSGRRWRLQWTDGGGTVRTGAPVRAYR